MQYIVAPNGTYAYRVYETGNVVWDANHICPAFRLTPEEATFFNVFPLYPTAQPAYDPLTQIVVELNPAFNAATGHWEQQWQVNALDATTIAANQAAATARAALAAQVAADQTSVATVKVDPLVQYIVSHTPAEISTYVGTQVTSLATAIPVLQKMAFVLSVLAKDKLR